MGLVRRDVGVLHRFVRVRPSGPHQTPTSQDMRLFREGGLPDLNRSPGGDRIDRRRHGSRSDRRVCLFRADRAAQPSVPAGARPGSRGRDPSLRDAGPARRIAGPPRAAPTGTRRDGLSWKASSPKSWERLWGASYHGEGSSAAPLCSGRLSLLILSASSDDPAAGVRSLVAASPTHAREARGAARSSPTQPRRAGGSRTTAVKPAVADAGTAGPASAARYPEAATPIARRERSWGDGGRSAAPLSATATPGTSSTATRTAITTARRATARAGAAAIAATTRAARGATAAWISRRDVPTTIVRTGRHPATGSGTGTATTPVPAAGRSSAGCIDATRRGTNGARAAPRDPPTRRRSATHRTA
jgi:hypothetical protein